MQKLKISSKQIKTGYFLTVNLSVLNINTIFLFPSYNRRTGFTCMRPVPEIFSLDQALFN
jgi:hypothetical protein